MDKCKIYYMNAENKIEKCNCCPRNCNAKRKDNKPGYCQTGDGFSIASIVRHLGEEPVISGKSGICNIFFTGCNLRCIYCQNHQISQTVSAQFNRNLDFIVAEVKKLMDSGVQAVGFVSASHVFNQVLKIISELHKSHIYPIIVYNTNAYEKTENIKALEGIVDVYLPDFKYISPGISLKYSGAADYPENAMAVIGEMYRQKGSTLHLNEDGIAEKGLIIRHLVLPGHVDESKKVLKYIAEEISTGVSISLMSQYYPAYKAKGHKTIGRSLYTNEYQDIVNFFYKLGFRNGFLQSLESNELYLPDFESDKPFK
ncbi:MAG: radical SAM protein [Bacteroidales bacterium]